MSLKNQSDYDVWQINMKFHLNYFPLLSRHFSVSFWTLIQQAPHEAPHPYTHTLIETNDKRHSAHGSDMMGKMKTENKARTAITPMRNLIPHHDNGHYPCMNETATHLPLHPQRICPQHKRERCENLQRTGTVKGQYLANAVEGVEQ